MPHPMLPVSIFRNLRFSAASVAVTASFFALFGFIFLITQYFQLVRGYGPLEAGVRTLPVAFSIALASVLAPRVVHQVGTTRVLAAGAPEATPSPLRRGSSAAARSRRTPERRQVGGGSANADDRCGGECVARLERKRKVEDVVE
jgi:hypothetical protein